MIKTSTLPSSLPSQNPEASIKEEQKLQNPDTFGIAEPSVSSINNILNYSKSLKMVKSQLVDEIEIIHT